ncbi:MAG: carboxypeptidase regulatory-like domain-containing protein [Acidobacteriota bacterium]
MTVPLLIAAIAAVTLEGRVVGPAGAPVAGAQIKVFGPQDAGGESTGEPAQTGATAEDGAFSFAGLARGTYVLQVSAPGLAPLEIGSVRVPGRARDVELVKGAPLRGAVYDAVTRALIAEARVEIASENGLPALASVRTGKRGELEIPALAPGSYNIVVKARGYAPEPRSVTIGGGEAAPFNVSLQKGAVLDVLVQGGDGAASRAVDRARVTLSCATTGSGVRADGEGTTGKDGKIVIESAPACDRYLATVRAAGWKSIERVQVMASQAGKDGARKVVIKLEKGVGISGRTVDEAGSPLASVSVWASGQAASGFALSDAAGAFRIDGLEPGKTSIWATLDGYIPEQEQELELGARGVSGKTLVLRSGRSASGHVHDGARHPVAGAEITIDSMETQSTGISDEAGAFTITGLGDGELTITVRAAGYQLLMTKANDGADLDLVLAHGSLLRGRILDAASGEGIGGGQVGVMPIAEGGGADMEAMGQYEGEGEDGFGAKSDASGAFELTGLKAGRFTLLAVATGYVYAVLPEVEILDGQDREGVVIKLERGGSVSGTVVRDKDGAPIAGAQVVISEDEGGLGTVAPAFTDARGRFRMEGLSGKRATLSVSHPEYASRDVEIALAEHGETAGAVVKLSAGARLKGIVMAGGVPLSGASVSAESGNTVTDASGSFDLDHLPAGLVRLYVSAPYRGGEEEDRRRSAGARMSRSPTARPASIVIDLEAGARITGRLLHRGRPYRAGTSASRIPPDGDRTPPSTPTAPSC